MSETYLVGYDTSPGGDRALDAAIRMANATGAKIRLVHVLEWSPYSFLTAEELDERHKRRNEELGRAEALLAPAMDKLMTAGIPAESLVRYGHVAETICAIAEEIDATQIIVGRVGSSTLSTRMFGSVQLTLVQAAPVAVTVVP